METFLERIKKAGGRIEESVGRFPFSFALLCLITINGVYMILAEKEAFELTFALTIGTLFCILAELSYEYGIHRMRLLIPAAALLSVSASYLLLKHHDNTYIYTALTGLCIASVALIAFVLYRNRENRFLFSHLIKSAFIVGVFAGVILSGISVCTALLQEITSCSNGTLMSLAMLRPPEPVMTAWMVWSPNSSCASLISSCTFKNALDICRSYLL